MENEPFDDLFREEDELTPSSDAEASSTSDQKVPSVSNIITILNQNSAAEHEFSSETEQYRVETSLRRNNQRWIYNLSVFHNTVEVQEGSLGPEEIRKKAILDDNGGKWDAFVKEAAEQHYARCRRVANLVAQAEPSRGGIGKKLFRLLVVILVFVSLLLNAATFYLYFHQDKLRDFLGWTASAGEIPPVHLEYETIRGTVQKEDGMPTIVLKKEDAVTIHVINDETGKPIQNGFINIELAGGKE